MVGTVRCKKKKKDNRDYKFFYVCHYFCSEEWKSNPGLSDSQLPSTTCILHYLVSSYQWGSEGEGVWGSEMGRVGVVSTMFSSLKISSVQSSHSAMSDCLQPHGPQHARPPCPSPTPGVYSNSCPLSRWCHPTISSSVVPFSSCPQPFPASGSFPVSQFFPQR